MMRRTLIVMAKAPQWGRVKTRLAKDVGQAEALAIYRRLSAAALRRLSGDPRWQVLLSIAPDALTPLAGAGPGGWPPFLERVAQGRGDLGARMERAFHRAPPGLSVMIGMDCPAIRAHHIEMAFRALGSHDAVFGPAEDGGFWLVGLRQRPFPHGIFESVRWSSEHALEDVLANLRPRHTVALIDRLRDIDTGADWDAWRSAKTP